MKTADNRIPGDLDHAGLIDRVLRVNQAGELGAVRIYQGQRAILGRKGGKVGPLLKRMAEQEQQHLDTFNRLIAERRTRPTLLSPLWHLAGFALGAGTALLGEKAAMACTVAVEETIDRHYARQAEQLGDDEAALKDTILRFRDEEIEHRDIGLEHGAEQAPAYPLLSAAVKGGCRLAIWLAERV
ncbi:ubiquinone biosynthesis protein COQ7 [Paramagnetospirillum caucaseum]|uniref:3-demethoxyubiquinol 3-hydroxylase n=1 Tax=Paramagnetospirillum caucaseum TaxID=1244869 RepID=M2ZN96_9PROT|nr:demethoxyubiquinone hydroxylase family protein [Paramagnetospirillum caucaseum]EME68767.1 ubiquinone biosynthesis protein COQ7 [Paramagnetospirillum caucaseum]